ncbi:hypothetical protein CTI12_AA110590 [Artemisia annua]|uniref:Uncharacterized protein n=1 Tax=Artemisia annua TaxID=35608 RepID=A0A2U1PVE5_ARTAN|nr:hypothetical protein CTI12_AA110590 [Artemisia annua]
MDQNDSSTHKMSDGKHPRQGPWTLFATKHYVVVDVLVTKGMKVKEGDPLLVLDIKQQATMAKSTRSTQSKRFKTPQAVSDEGLNYGQANKKQKQYDFMQQLEESRIIKNQISFVFHKIVTVSLIICAKRSLNPIGCKPLKCDRISGFRPLVKTVYDSDLLKRVRQVNDIGQTKRRTLTAQGNCLVAEVMVVKGMEVKPREPLYLGIQQVVFGGRSMGDWEEGMKNPEDGYKSFKILDWYDPQSSSVEAESGPRSGQKNINLIHRIACLFHIVPFGSTLGCFRIGMLPVFPHSLIMLQLSDPQTYSPSKSESTTVPFTVNLYHDGFSVENFIAYMEGDFKIKDNVDFEDMFIRSCSIR